jgi:tetratricopeptide (TPR) repeat protein
LCTVTNYLKDYSTATKFFLKAINLCNSFDRASLWLGRTYLKLREHSEAQKYFQKAFDGGNSQAKEELDKILSPLSRFMVVTAVSANAPK